MYNISRLCIVLTYSWVINFYIHSFIHSSIHPFISPPPLPMSSAYSTASSCETTLCLSKSILFSAMTMMMSSDVARRSSRTHPCTRPKDARSVQSNTRMAAGGGWRDGCVGVWVYGCMGVWVYGCVGVWVYGCVGVWVYGCVGVWVYE